MLLALVAFIALLLAYKLSTDLPPDLPGQRRDLPAAALPPPDPL